MIRQFTLAAALGLGLAAPAAMAETTMLETLTGEWRGTGTNVMPGGDSRRLTCRMEGAPAQDGLLRLSGRCASSGLSRDFAFLVGQADNRLEAMRLNSVDRPIEPRLRGTREGDAITLAGGEGAERYEVTLRFGAEALEMDTVFTTANGTDTAEIVYRRSR